MKHARRAVLFAATLLAGCHDAADPCRPPLTAADEAAPPARHTPRWAFEPWISKDISDTDDTYAFVEGFASRDIPVGVVVLDSPWETQYNTFVPSPTRYHDFAKLLADLHARDIRLVLWTTQMVNN
jgi:alpha-D-xyloside xylohydrolase